MIELTKRSHTVKFCFARCLRALVCTCLLCAIGPALANKQAATATDCASSLDCLLCSALDEHESYTEGSMKLLSRIAPGKDHWLFRSEVDFSKNFGIPAHMTGEFKRLVESFRRHGITLVMAIQPTRGLMHRDKIREDWSYGFDYVQSAARLRHFLEQMRHAGAVVPDVMRLVENPPPEEFFFRRDHHWTPSGAQATARLVADEIRQHPAYAQLSKRKYRTEPSAVVYKDGTLNVGLRYLCGNNFSMQFVRGFRTVPLTEDGAALFEEVPDPEVVLVGTSNSAVRESENRVFNFDGYLKQYLETDILNYALPGAGDDGSLLEYLLSDNYSVKKPPKLIIWELPANYQLADPNTYRELIPAIRGGCMAPHLLSKQVHRPNLKAGERIEVLNNAAAQQQPLNNRGGLIDLKFSDRNFKQFYVLVYYDNGGRDKVWFRREAIVTGGQYYLELSRDPLLRQANLLSIIIEPTQDLPGPVTIDIGVCP
jgi:alginate biosynthesis protein AlgX